MSRFTSGFLFITLLMLCLCPTLVSQSQSGQLTFRLDVVLNKPELAGNPDSINDKLETLQFVEKMIGLTSLGSSMSEKWVYAFTDSLVRRLEGNRLFRTESFDLYEVKSRLKTYRRFRKDNLDDFRIDTISLNTKDSYTYRLIEQDTSMIEVSGFNCYRIIFEETHTLKFGGPMVTRYDVLATPEIELDPSFLLDWREQIIEHCPVYIKSWIVGHENMYNQLQLISFSPEYDKDAFVIPEKFKQP